jgi:serine/threonine protein kinase
MSEQTTSRDSRAPSGQKPRGAPPERHELLDAWVLRVLGFDPAARRGTDDHSSSSGGGNRGTVFDSVPDLGGSGSGSTQGTVFDTFPPLSGSGSTDSSSFSSSFSSSVDSDSDDDDTNAPRRPSPPLPPGVDLSEAKLGTSIKSGAFGSVSWVDGAKGTPPLVIKVPKSSNVRSELEHEAEYYEKIGPHPNIATCLGMQTIDGQNGLVMEGIKGSDMRGVMEKLEKLSKADPQTLKALGFDRALTHEEYVGAMQYMLRETLKGLDHLESKGVVHSDIRPDNVMCDSETGEVKIVDFGLAFDSDKPMEGRIAPTGHGMVTPEQGTQGSIVTSKVDVFATGELARLSMEGDQFRYGTNKAQRDLNWNDVRAFGEKDEEGHDKQALRPMPEPEAPPKGSDGGPARPGERVGQLRGRIRRLAEDRVLKDNPTVQELSHLIEDLGRRSPNVEDSELSDIETRMAIAERSLKTTGTYGAKTAYTDFVNWAMSPDQTKRPTAKKALEDKFLQDSLIDDDTARAVLKKILAPTTTTTSPQNDSGATDSSSTWSSTSSTTFSTSSSSSSTDSDPFQSTDQPSESGSGGPDRNGLITKRDESGYTVWLTEGGSWSRDQRQAKKFAPGERPTQPQGESIPSPSVSEDNDSVSFDSSLSVGTGSSLGSSSEDAPGKDGLVSQKDDQGYTVWKTEDGGWSRDRQRAKKFAPGGTDTKENVLRESIPPSGYSNPGRFGSDLYTTDLNLTLETKQDGPPSQPEQNGDTGSGGGSGWTGAKPSEGSQRGGGKIGSSRSSGKQGTGGQTPPPGQQGGWTDAKPSEGTQRGGGTIGSGRSSGKKDTSGQTPPTGQGGGWTGAKPSEGTQRGGGTIGSGRSSGKQGTSGQTPPPGQQGGWTGAKPSEGTRRGGKPMGTRRSPPK